jgi:osmotically-inducible protein OsmY
MNIGQAGDQGGSAVPDSELANSIERALRRDIRLHLDGLTVTSTQGAVALSGVAHSWPEHDAAIEAAWATPGVREVHDRLVVRPDTS